MITARGQLRIIAGKWRSRKLTFPDEEALRPTPDRVRETLFNWLQADVPGSRCLDLFAGSGVLGFEAASRGAAEVVMIEQNSKVSTVLDVNRKILGADNIETRTDNALAWLKRNTRSFDIIFVDPPYRSGLISPVCVLLDSGQSLKEHAKIYIEHALDDEAEAAVPDNWACLRKKSAGQVVYKLYSRGT